MTAAQERALDELWPRYGIDSGDGLLDLDLIFGRQARRCLEIGFGAGEVIASLAEVHPEIDYVGIEVHRPGVGRLLLRAQQAGLSNLRVISNDAVEVLRHRTGHESFDEVLVFFPDPWHKKRHYKRRLIDAEFITAVAASLRPRGVLRMATDWQHYAEQMLDVANANPNLQSLSPDAAFVTRPEFRPVTRFEARGTRLGHGVWDLAYVKKAAPNAVDDELHRERSQNDA